LPQEQPPELGQALRDAEPAAAGGELCATTIAKFIARLTL